MLFMFFLLRFLTLQILAWVKKWPSDRITNKTKKSPNYSGIKDTVEASAGSVRWPLVAYKHLCSHRKIKQKDTCYCSAVNLDRRWEATLLEGALVAKSREEAALEGWASLSCSSQRLSSKKLEPTEGWDTLRAGAPCGGDLFALQVLDAISAI